MPQALHEIRALRQGRPVRNVEPWLAELDLNNVPLLRDVLTRHLVAVAQRSGIQDDRPHLYSLEVYAVHNGKGYGHPLYRWALPAGMYL